MIDLGLPIALSASIIALWGVWLFNQRRDYTRARGVWTWSNTMFVLYFFGRILGWWNGVLGDVAMLAYFLGMWASNLNGMGIGWGTITAYFGAAKSK